MNEMSAAPVRPPVSIAFSGVRGDFSRLVTRGAFLELITFGFYRFWLATDMRRHLWSHTDVAGDTAEYTGRGRELLVGFLFAMAILVPVYIAYFLVTIEAERFREFASFPLLLFFYVFGQFAIYRARRYRLTRTVWRGVRFWMSGSGWAYALRASLWGLLMIPTLGLILPWRDAALERYKMRHSFYGELQGSFEGRGGELFKRGWWLWLLTIGVLIGVSISALVYGATLILVLAAPFIYGAFKAVQWRWWLSGIRFGGVALDSKLPTGALIGLYWKVIGWFVLLAVLLAAYLALAAAVTGNMNAVSMQQLSATGDLAKSIPLLVLGAVGYLAFLLAGNVVMRVYLVRDLWARVVPSTTLSGIEAAERVTAKGELANALGEGLSDGLDVAGF
jgi:uncharacterized membrane protein YjgN (DUF898 family)